MSVSSTLDRYTDRLAGMDPNAFIGSLLWFSITGVIDRTDGKRSTVPVRVTRDLLAQWFDELKLNPAFLPPQIGKANAFRAASTDMDRSYDIDANGRSASLMVREVLFDDERIVRHITMETRDRKGATLTYDKVCSITFYRGAKARGSVATGEHYKYRIVDGLAPQDRAQVEVLLKDLQARYDDLTVNLQSQAIRTVIRNYVTHLNAIPVKPSGGLYFIHNSHQDELNSLQALVARIGQGCSFSQCPLVDTSEQRTMLTEAFEDDVEDEVRLLLEDLAEVKDKAKAKGKTRDFVTPQSYAAAMNKWQRIAGRSAEYTDKLGLRQERAASALDVALKAVLEMQRNLQTPASKKGGK